MTEPEKPGEGTPSSYSLPSWIDHAIARSKSDEPPAPPDESEPVGPAEPEEECAAESAGLSGASSAEEVSETAETREFPLPSLPADTAPPPRTPEDSDTREKVPSFLASEEPFDPARASATVSGSPEAEHTPVGPDVTAETHATPVADPRDRERAALPWVIAALFLTAAALVLAYLIWLRPTS